VPAALIKGPRALNPSPLLVRGDFDANSLLEFGIMALDAFGDLPRSVKFLFDGWQGLRAPAVNAAVEAWSDDPTSGFATPSMWKGAM
jgi:hypothetical protein